MPRNRPLILSTLLAMLSSMACIALLPSRPTAAITPASVAAATPTLVSAASSPSPTVSIPAFDSFLPVTRLALAESERVLDMVPESGGIIWLLTDQRVMKYSQGAWTDYLSQFNGQIIGLDPHYHVWVVNDDDSQVSVWDGSRWTNLGPETGWQPPIPDNGAELVWSVAVDALGQVWLAANHEVRVFDGAKWKVFNLNELGIPGPEIEDAFSETTITFLKASGYIWVTHCYWVGPGPAGGGGARWYDGHAWQGSDSPVARGCATLVKEDSRGNIWLGLDQDLWRRDTSTHSWKRFSPPKPPEGQRFGFLTDLALDSSGNPWPELSLCGGASCYAGNIRYRVTIEKWNQIGDSAMDTSSLYFDAIGQGRVFAFDGVFLITGDRLEPVVELSVLKVAKDSAGKLWILGNYDGEVWLWAQS